ncbi:MAG TPA: hypothetical protein PLD51_05450 [Pontiellaceae bacterium]|nr:hypothetical protein [Pontiellaceae bacterium]HPR83287.1 hypothetical protein [Pontiellaceae bacterium]
MEQQWISVDLQPFRSFDQYAAVVRLGMFRGQRFGFADDLHQLDYLEFAGMGFFSNVQQLAGKLIQPFAGGTEMFKSRVAFFRDVSAGAIADGQYIPDVVRKGCGKQSGRGASFRRKQGFAMLLKFFLAPDNLPEKTE